jgi:hypothetical protein
VYKQTPHATYKSAFHGLLGLIQYLAAVIAAYATASAEGKHLIESVVQETDPAFLVQLLKETP